MPRSDMFFKANGQRTGAIVGEAVDRRFAGQIDIIDWSWGMTAPTAVSGQLTGRVQLKELRLVKRVDRASPALMSVMRSNEILTTATLSVRKAGGADPLPYFVLELEKARIVGYDIDSDVDSSGAPTLTERLLLTFLKLTATYTGQGATGAGGGGIVAVIDNSAAG